MKYLLMTVLSLLMVSGAWAAEETAKPKPFDLTTLLGQTYKNCQIIKATPEYITIVHDSGVSKISFEQLGDEWKVKFNYDPAKAKEFASAEAAKRQEIEDKKKLVNSDRERMESEKIAALAEAENKRLAEEAARRKEQMEAAKDAPPVPPGVNPVAVTTEVVVPAFTPISQAYSPGANSSQHFIISNGGGYYQSGYSTGGYGAGYVYPPVYAYPYSGGYGYPPVVPVCRPPVVTRPIISGTIRTGNGFIQINR